MSRSISTSLDGKVVLVTGAASGIGKAFVALAAADGAKVVGVDRNEAALNEVVSAARDAGGTAIACTADVTDSAGVKAAVSAAVADYGRLDGCFNNAGVTAPVIAMPDYPEAEFERIMRINVWGCFHVLKHAMAVMRDQKSGAIVNTGSTSGLRGIPNFAPYIASKHAVLGLTKTAAMEGVAYGVRVNAICPGMTETPINDEFHRFANPDDPEETRRQFSARIPAGRYADAEELAAVAMFLLSDSASYVIGEVVNVDGALTTGI